MHASYTAAADHRYELSGSSIYPETSDIKLNKIKKRRRSKVSIERQKVVKQVFSKYTSIEVFFLLCFSLPLILYFKYTYIYVPI